MERALCAKPWVGLVIAVAVCGLVLPSASVGSATSSGPALVKARYNKQLKRKIVVDTRGRTLYMFTADTSGTSNCTDSLCMKLWPALITTGAPVAGPGIKAGLLGVTARPNGRQQVTYNHHPLYFFHGGYGYRVGDRKPGQIRGEAYFGAWWVLSPKGKPIKR